MHPLTFAPLTISGESILAYKMVAKRENETVKYQRNSALIVLANARVWDSEGWQVTITDAEGRDFDPASFEQRFAWIHPSAGRAIPSSAEEIQPAE